MCKWARWRIDEIRAHKIVRKKILVKMNWMKRAERMSGGEEEKLNTMKWKKPANSIDLDQFPLIFLLLPFVDLYFICAVAFISNQSNEQVQSAKKTTTTHKIFILFSPLSIRCFPLQYLPNTPDIHRHTQTRIYVEWIERIWVQVSALFVCLFIWFVHSLIRSPQVQRSGHSTWMQVNIMVCADRIM